jgi:SMI1 / KNR4 family (SUKH-1)
MVQVERIKEKLGLLRSYDLNEIVGEYGTSSSREVYSESEITEFEAKYSITLPREYRDFLLLVHGGGLGPGNGIFQLENSIDFGWSKREIKNVSEPFPLSGGISIVPNGIVDFTPLNGKQFYEHQNSVFVLWEHFNEESTNLSEKSFDLSEFDFGHLYLSHVGCGMCFVLIISGEAKGSIWFKDLGNDNGFYPLTKNHERLEYVDFLTFYENWLGACLRILNGLEGYPQDDWWLCLGYTDYVHE